MADIAQFDSKSKVNVVAELLQLASWENNIRRHSTFYLCSKMQLLSVKIKTILFLIMIRTLYGLQDQALFKAIAIMVL